MESGGPKQRLNINHNIGKRLNMISKRLNEYGCIEKIDYIVTTKMISF